MLKPETSVPHPQTGEVSVALVIPAFEEAATIADVLARCRTTLPGAPVVVVDDGSRDGSGAIAAASGAVVLRQERNLGKGASLARGLQHALALGAALIVTLDADGQHRPEDLPLLLACAARWPDRIVIGSRRAGRASAPRGRRISNQVADFWISWAAGWPIEDSQSGFRVYPASVLRLVSLPSVRGFAWESDMLIAAGRCGIQTAGVAIPAIYGAALKRRSHFRPVADITRIVLAVGGHLLRRGLHPAGLLRILMKKKA